MSQKTLIRKVEQLERAHRLVLTENAQLRELVAHAAPLRDLSSVYSTILAQADTLKGRSLEAPRGVAEFDRPPFNAATARWRSWLAKANRVISELAASGSALLGDPVDASSSDDMCGTCGRTQWDRGYRTAVRAAQDFLEDALAAGPEEAHVVQQMAIRAGHAARTVGRASRILVKTRRQGRWWWQLPSESVEVSHGERARR